MPNSRPAAVRSHRRGGPRRGPRLAPWIVVTVVVLLVAGGLTAGYTWVVRESCSGRVSANVVASPEAAPILEGLSRDWAATGPSVNGTCAAVEVTGRDSAEMAIALQNPWDSKVNGPAPDAWVPQSTAWVRRASADADAERMVPDRQPSIGRSPAVLAMPKPMAEKLGWPQQPLKWQTVVDAATQKMNWSTYGQPTWGPFRFGMTDPAKSTAGLLSLTALLDANDDEEISTSEQNGLYRLKQAVSVLADSTEQIIGEYTTRSKQSAEAGLSYISAFPALEQDVLSHNLSNPESPLVAIYPETGSIEADHPFLVLNADWSNPQRQSAATEFMNFVRNHDSEQKLLDAGLRDPNRLPGRNLTVQNGLAPEITTLPRGVLLADSVARTINTWTALTRPTNILLVLDVSGSMNTVVPGAGGTRLDLAKKAARGALDLFPNDAKVGLWAFSTALNGRTDYKTVVPLDTLGDTAGGQTRRTQMANGINGLQAKGDTGLYDTAAAAQKFLIDNFQKDAVNLVVLMTDGKNEDTTGGLQFEQLTAQLTQNNADAARKVSVSTVGFGDAADYPKLQEISRLTGGIAFESRQSFDINQVLLSAIFNNV